MAKLALRLGIILILVLVGTQIAAMTPGFDTFNEHWIDAHTRDNGMAGVINFIIVATALLLVGLPRQMVAFLGGYAFGFAEGLVYSTLAATVGCAITLFLSRWFARPWVNRHFAHKMHRIERFLCNDPTLKTIVIRLLPVGNNQITNLVAGVTKVSALAFVLGSLFGYVPQMAIFALMGKGVVVQSTAQITLSVALMGLSTIIGIYLYKKYRAERVLDSNNERSLDIAHTPTK